jgi:hypothetical protein
VEYAGEHAGLAWVELAAARTAGDDQLEVLGRGDLLELGLRVDSDQA